VAAEAATSLRRGVAILLTLGSTEADGAGLSVTRIAELIGREKSQVSRTLKILTEYGLVERDPATLAYRLGWGLFALAARNGVHRLLVEARPVLRRLVDDLGETAHLSVLNGAEVMTLLSEAPPHAIRATGWIGRAVPVHCTSSGRALLFDHGPGELAALFAAADPRACGPRAPRSADDLAKRVAAARARGYAAVEEEFEVDLVAVGAPVRDFTGQIVAALNVSAPKFRFGRRLRGAGETVRAAAEDLSARLGAGEPGQASAVGEAHTSAAPANPDAAQASKPLTARRTRARLTATSHRAINATRSTAEGA
jgi:IclR family KDG regulon transcriptional repressor